MLNIELFVSCGSDRDAYRDIAKDAFERLRQVIQFEMKLDVTIANWDYRAATPTVVARGALASTSLANVDRANALVAIFGRRVPSITREEVRRAFERRRGGERQVVFVFAHPGLLSPRHRSFLQEVEDDFGETIVYAPYTNQVTFQASLYTTLFQYLFGQLGTANPALLTGAP
jgi:hypothetical protein